MNSLKKLSWVVAALLSLLAQATPMSVVDPHPILSRYFVATPSDTAMRAIGTRFEVEKREVNGYVVIVPAKHRDELLALAPQARLVDADITASLLAKVGWQRQGWHDFDSVQSDLDQLVKSYPQLASVEQYGQSQEGRPLRVLRLTGKARPAGAKPQIVITGATHGNELITVEVVFGLVNALVKGYGNDSRLTKMLDTHELYFVPVVNADGYVRMERYCNGIDPNRDYPYPQDEHHQSNPAITSIMDFFSKHHIAGSIDYHSAAGMIMYPWAWTYDPIPDADRTPLEDLTSRMADTNGYQHGPIASTIYIAPGSSADYYYWKFHTRALGIEISQDGSPSLIPSMIQENMESTWIFIESF